jgi:metastasis-associated protein MTA
VNDEGVNSDSTNDSTVNGGDHLNGVQLNGDLNELQKYQLKHRELFYSKYTDTIPATTIRAKCSVLLFHSDIEKLNDYMSHDDQYYYTLTYDPYQRTIVADKGEIRVGFKYQVEIPSILSADQHDADAMRKYDELKWSTGHQLTDREIEQFLIIAKSIGTFARALDCNNAYKQPSLPLSAAAASRDITLVCHIDLTCCCCCC